MKAIKVKKSEAEKVKILLSSKKVLDKKYKVCSGGDFVYFPVLSKVKGFKLVEKKFSCINLFDLDKELNKILNSKEFSLLKKSMELLGSICILEIDEELRHKEKEIANVFLEGLKNVKTVVRKDSKHSGIFRRQKHKYLAGLRKKETIYVENGLKIKLNIDKVYFSSRLARDRLKVAERVKKGENVLVMFSGVGVYGLTIAKYSDAKVIYCVEINPEACKYAEENVKLNKIKNINLICGDVRKVCPKIKFDRIIMPLPAKAYDYLDLVKGLLKDKGVVNLYSFENNFNEVWDKIPFSFKKNDLWKCCQIAPRTYRICAEFSLK